MDILDHVLLKRHIRDKVLTKDGQFLVVQAEMTASDFLRKKIYGFVLFHFDTLSYFFTKELDRCCLLVLVLKLCNAEVNIYSTNNIISFALCEQIVLNAAKKENLLMNEKGLIKKQVTFFDYEVIDDFIGITG